MKTIIKLFICISLIYTPFLVFAGAAEKWEYEPVMKDMNIHVTGHKVDQYGAAVNDYEYNTKIDPKTAANRTKAGTVGMGRLLKTTGWGLLGSAALEALLEAVDWVIDPETQSIWRNKKSDTPSYDVCFDGRYLFRAQTGSLEKCPDVAIKKFWDSVSSSDVKYVFHSYQVTPKDVLVDKKGTEILYTVTQIVDGYRTNTPNQRLTYTANPNYVPKPQEKEYLTPEALADYANHTHPDYADPELAPKLAPKYSPEIASDLWKPSNPWEETNSPTVQEVNKKLDEAAPEPKTEPELTPNPETGGTTLPSFCSWAAPVCEYFKWAKQDDDLPDDEKPEIKDLPTPELKEDAIRWSAQCPADVQVPITMQGVSSTITFSWSPWCQLLSIIKPAIIASAYIGAAFIVLGLRT